MFENMVMNLIRPMKLYGVTKPKKIPISELKPGIEVNFEVSEAVVAYFDILGFSDKKNDEDIEACLADFSAALILSARQNPNIRFNIFSDCAFLSASIKDAANLLSAIRFAFLGWIADGILVRGGISIGSYKEIRTAAQDMSSRNVVSSLFSGSGVTKAVRLENGPAALLFTDNTCKELYSLHYGEPIFSLDDHMIIGWSDERQPLYQFAALSLIRLLKLLAVRDEKYRSIKEKLLNNLRYSDTAIGDRLFLLSLALPILSLPVITSEVRGNALSLLRIEPEYFEYCCKNLAESCDAWLNKVENKMLLALADMDSSIPQSLNFTLCE
jgi:hypothetical protein